MRFLAFFATACAVLLASLTASASVDSVIDADRNRIQKHLALVEATLRAKDTSHLTPELQAARKANLDRLHQYRLAGVFPRNTVSPDRIPVFIDPDGRACAVAHLMIESGWKTQAEAISSRENLARLPDMRSPEVGAWLATSGLTAEEATWIQPGYNPCNDGCSCDVDVVCGNDGKTYVNECFARNCGGVSAVKSGCCLVDDFIESSWSDEYGAIGTICNEDPNPRSDTSPDAGTPVNPLCAEAVDPPDSDPSGPEPGTTGGEKTDPSACQTTGGFKPAGGAMVVLFALAFAGWSRRRR